MVAVICAALVCACATDTPGGWDGRSPNENADRLVTLFRDVCVAKLGRAHDMAGVIAGSGTGFRSDFVGDAQWGPVWSSPLGRITATDHGHNHDGDECRIELRRPVAPSAAATIEALRRQKLVEGHGVPGEFGATTFNRGDTRIVIRHDVAEDSTGVTSEDASLTLLIDRPAG